MKAWRNALAYGPGHLANDLCASEFRPAGGAHWERGHLARLNGGAGVHTRQHRPAGILPAISARGRRAAECGENNLFIYGVGC